MRGEWMDVDGEPGEQRQRADRGMERGRIVRLPDAPVRAAGDPPEALDPALLRELAGFRALGRGEAIELARITFVGPQDVNVDEEFHRYDLTSAGNATCPGRPMTCMSCRLIPFGSLK